jgi:uncharacterized membrane protein YgcG
MVAMRASWRKGLSGAVSAIVIAVVLVAGLASASYINLTAARYNEAQMQEALRQARLGSELIRIHIHSTDGAVDSPPRITFVNAWGYESRIIQLVIIGRETSGGSGGGGGGNNGGGGRRCHIVDGILECEIGEDGNTGGSTGGYTRTSTGGGQSQTQVIATIDLRDRPIVLPPGARLTIDPAQIGLSYPTFKRMADAIRSIHAYTEAGNSFGSTWGFPREDNMAGRTVATTYNVTTTNVWYVPSLTWINNTFTRSSYITIGPIPPVGNTTIKAVNHFETSVLRFALNPSLRSISSSSWGSSGEPSDPQAPMPSNSFTPVDTGIDRYLWCWNGGNGNNCNTLNNRDDWYWYPLQQYVAVEGQTKIVEGGTYHTLFNGPVFYTQSFTVNLGVDEGARSEPWRPPPERYAQVAVTYRLARVEITPNPPDFQVQTATMTRTGMVLQPTVGIRYTTTYTSQNRPVTTTVTIITGLGPMITAFNKGDMMTMLLYNGGPDIYCYEDYSSEPYIKCKRLPEFTYDGRRVDFRLDITQLPDTARKTYTGYIYKLASEWYCYYGCRWREYQYNAGPFNGYLAYATQILQLLPKSDMRTMYVLLPPGNYTVNRYYMVDNIQVNTYVPPPPSPPPGPITPSTRGPDPPPPRIYCDVVGPGDSGGSSSGGDTSSSGSSGVSVQVLARYVRRC